jgi:hypothetical protein
VRKRQRKADEGTPEILKTLYDAQIDFVVIGGAAMLLQGSAYVTKDVGFCYARTPQNIKRLTAALKPYHPLLRGAGRLVVYF